MSKLRMKMRNMVALAICLAATSVVFTACDKDNAQKNALNIAAINSNSSKIVTKHLKSMEGKSFPIDCYVFSTITFDTRNNSYGYADCNGIYHFIDVETGEEIKRIPLPVGLGFVELDMARNRLIGHYYDDGKDYVVSIDLNSGNVVSNKPFYDDGLWNGMVSFFRSVENEYVLLHPDNGLVFINPSTGNINRTLNIESTCILNVVYDSKNNRIIGITCVSEIGENHIVTIDLNTGKTLSKKRCEGVGSDFSFVGGEMDYDAESNSYILISANEVLFFDIATGKVKEKYQLDFDVTSLKVWRNRK